jgi:hypothetical protein
VRLFVVTFVAAALLALSASSVSASHIGSTLDCGEAGVFTTSGTDWLPSGFQAPVGSVFLLEETTQQFVFFARESVPGGAWTIWAPGKFANQGDSLLACDFTRSDQTAVSAIYYGMLTPQP